MTTKVAKLQRASLNKPVRVEVSSKYVALGRHGSREKICISLFGDDFEDLIDDRAEVHIKQPICFIQNLQDLVRLAAPPETILTESCRFWMKQIGCLIWTSARSSINSMKPAAVWPPWSSW
jgi:hypothetical protein